MAEEEKKSKSPFDFQSLPFIKFQQEFLANWQKSFQQGFEQLQKFWTKEGVIPGPERFMEFIKSQMSLLTESGPKWLGLEVFERVFNASQIYAKVLEFWRDVLAPSLTGPQGKVDPEKLKELSQNWLNSYEETINRIFGDFATESRKQMIKSTGQIVRTQLDAFWNYWLPLIENFEGFPEKLMSSLSGDYKAIQEIYHIMRRAYEDGFGKIFHLPTMGYFREVMEKINNAIDSYIDYLLAMNEYYSLFYQTALRATEKVISRINEFKDEDWSSPEGVRKFYRLWWTINEDTYHELFLSPEFTSLLKEVLRRGLILKKWTDEITDKLLESTPLPRKKDMDEIYRAIYELKKEVRWHRRYIEKLKGGEIEEE